MSKQSHSKRTARTNLQGMVHKTSVSEVTHKTNKSWYQIDELDPYEHKTMTIHTDDLIRPIGFINFESLERNKNG